MADDGKQPRRYGFACVTCRRRKIRCDGKKPICHRCLKSNEDCNYKSEEKSDHELVHQLTNARQRIKSLEEGLQKLALADREERDKVLIELCNDLGVGGSDDIQQSLADDAETRNDTPDPEKLEQSEITIDENGSVCPFCTMTWMSHS